MVDVGDTLIDALLAPPGLQLYVPPAVLGVAVNVPISPSQIVILSTLTVGSGVTVTVACAVVAGHPFSI